MWSAAIVVKPHEGFRVLKDKPRLAGKESIIRLENSFSLFFFPIPISFLTLHPTPGPVFHQILSSLLHFLRFHFFHSLTH